MGPGSIYSASRLGRTLLSSVEDCAFLAGFVLCVGMGLMEKERDGRAETMYPVSFPWALATKHCIPQSPLTLTQRHGLYFGGQWDI